MDLRHFLIALLVVFWSLSVSANSALELASEENLCLQTGIQDTHWSRAQKKHSSHWSWYGMPAWVFMDACNQSYGQQWEVDNDSVLSYGRQLGVMRFGKRFVPLVSDRRFARKRLSRKWIPLSLKQGRLVFSFQNKEYCLIANGYQRFDTRLLEECLNSPELSTASRWLYGLPPEPGEEGLVGLEGIDSDQDGVRDDVQRYIEKAMPDSEVTRKAARQVAAALQKKLSNAYNESIVTELQTESFAASDCLFYVLDGKSGKYLQRLKALTNNTEERLKAWNRSNSYFSGMTFSLPDDMESQCNFDVNQ